MNYESDRFAVRMISAATPVIALTAYAMAGDREAAPAAISSTRSMGLDRLLRKIDALIAR